MFKTETKLKAWGNSIGIVLPKDELEQENLSVNDEVDIVVKKKETIKDIFGKLKEFKPKSDKPTNELLKEIDEELKSRFD